MKTTPSCLFILGLLVGAAFADPATGWLRTAAGTYYFDDTANWVNGEINGIFGPDLAIEGQQNIRLRADTTLPNGLSFRHSSATGKIAVKLESSGSAYRLSPNGNIVVATDGSPVTIGGSGTKNISLDLGGTTRTISVAADSGQLNLYANLQNGGVVYANEAPVYLFGNNTYTNGTVFMGTTNINLEADHVIGPGPITFSEGCRFDTGSKLTTTVVDDNPPITIAGSFTFASGKGALDVGDGPITLLQPLTITVTSGKSFLRLGGQFQGDYGIFDLTKAGDGPLVLGGEYTFKPGDALAISKGSIDFAGTINDAIPGIAPGNYGTVSVSGAIGSDTLTFTGTASLTNAFDYAGTVVVASNATLTLDGPAGSFTNADIRVEQGTLALGLSAVSVDVLRAKSVTLQSGRLRLTSSKTVSVTNRIGTLVVDTRPGFGGTAHLDLSGIPSGNTSLQIGAVEQRHFAMLNITGSTALLGQTDFASGFNVAAGSGIANVGSGTVGTTTAPCVPWIRSGGTFVYFDAVRGLRLHSAAERNEAYANGYEGPVATPGENFNLDIAGNATVKLTGGNIDVATFAVDSSYQGQFVYATNDIVRVQSGALYLCKKGNAVAHIDLCGRHGYFFGGEGASAAFNGRVTGTTKGITIATGAIVSGSNYSIDFGLNAVKYNVPTDSTYSGDVHIHGSVYPNSSEFFPHGSGRRGNIYHEGYWRVAKSQSASINGLYGGGRILLDTASKGKRTLTLGCDNSDGDFTGTFGVLDTILAGNEGKAYKDQDILSLVKTGSGTQRFAGLCSHNGDTTVEGGTLRVDGDFLHSSVSVAAGATLAGSGAISNAVAVAAGATLAPGPGVDTPLEVGSLAVEDGAVYAVYADKHAGATSTAVEDAVTGSGTVLVAVSGEGSGRWKILSATSFEPTFAMAPDSSGSLSVVTAEGGVELWYERFEDGTLILLR